MPDAAPKADDVAAVAPNEVARETLRTSMPPELTGQWRFPDARGRPDAAQRLAARLSAQLESEFDQRALLPGYSFVLVVDGTDVLVKAQGMADARAKRPVTPDTIFRIGSLTKTFTAAAVLALRDEGQLTLGDPLAMHLPELDAAHPHADSSVLRLEHVLTHSAGFAAAGPYASLPRPSTEADLVDALKLPLVEDPAVTYRYSNLGFALLGLLVHRKAGIPYRDFVRTRLLEPLGMTSSSFDLAALPRQRLAVATVTDGSARAATPNGAAEGAGGLFSTATDLARWLRFQLAAWPPRDEADRGPLRRATLREMHAPRVPVGFVPASEPPPFRAHAKSVGLAWQVTSGCYFTRLIGHEGALHGFRAVIKADVDRNFGFVLLTNGEASDVSGITDRLLDTIASENLLAAREREPSTRPVEHVQPLRREEAAARSAPARCLR